MRIVKLTAILVLSVLMFSCKKDKNEPDKITPVVGAWYDMLGDDVSYISVSGRGTVCSVDDLEINNITSVDGKLYVYIRHSVGKMRAYYHIPDEVPGIGRVREPETGAGGYGFLVQEKPTASLMTYHHVRALIIPDDAGLPGTLDMGNYLDVMEYFELED